MRGALAFGVTMLVVGCAHVDDVKGPSGEPAHRIGCSESSECFRLAAETCPDGYRIRKGKDHGTELVVTCAADVPKSEDAPAPSVEVDPERRTRGEDRRNWDHAPVCEAAYNEVAGFSTYWATSSHAFKPLDEPPTRVAFVKTCDAMPENVQRCMHEKYRAANVEKCATAFTKLPVPLRDKIDTLFLQPPQNRPPPRPRAPGDTT